MRDDQPLNAEAQAHRSAVLRRAVIAKMRGDADELAQLVRPPVRRHIPPGPAGRRVLMRMLIAERRRSERLLELMVR